MVGVTSINWRFLRSSIQKKLKHSIDTHSIKVDAKNIYFLYSHFQYRRNSAIKHKELKELIKNEHVQMLYSILC